MDPRGMEEGAPTPRQMVMCPVRIIYDTHIVLQPGDQTNQVIYISPPPPLQWNPQASQLYLANQASYVQGQVPTGNQQIYLPQMIPAQPMLQNYQNQLISHQPAEYHVGLNQPLQHQIRPGQWHQQGIYSSETQALIHQQPPGLINIQPRPKQYLRATSEMPTLSATSISSPPQSQIYTMAGVRTSNYKNARTLNNPHINYVPQPLQPFVGSTQIPQETNVNPNANRNLIAKLGNKPTRPPKTVKKEKQHPWHRAGRSATTPAELSSNVETFTQPKYNTAPHMPIDSIDKEQRAKDDVMMFFNNLGTSLAQHDKGNKYTESTVTTTVKVSKHLQNKSSDYARMFNFISNINGKAPAASTNSVHSQIQVKTEPMTVLNSFGTALEKHEVGDKKPESTVTTQGEIASGEIWKVPSTEDVSHDVQNESTDNTGVRDNNINGISLAVPTKSINNQQEVKDEPMVLLNNLVTALEKHDIGQNNPESTIPTRHNKRNCKTLSEPSKNMSLDNLQNTPTDNTVLCSNHERDMDYQNDVIDKTPVLPITSINHQKQLTDEPMIILYNQEKSLNQRDDGDRATKSNITSNSQISSDENISENPKENLSYDLKIKSNEYNHNKNVDLETDTNEKTPLTAKCHTNKKLVNDKPTTLHHNLVPEGCNMCTESTAAIEQRTPQLQVLITQLPRNEFYNIQSKLTDINAENNENINSKSNTDKKSIVKSTGAINNEQRVQDEPVIPSTNYVTAQVDCDVCKSVITTNYNTACAKTSSENATQNVHTKSKGNSSKNSMNITIKAEKTSPNTSTGPSVDDDLHIKVENAHSTYASIKHETVQNDVLVLHDLKNKPNDNIKSNKKRKLDFADDNTNVKMPKRGTTDSNCNAIAQDGQHKKTILPDDECTSSNDTLVTPEPHKGDARSLRPHDDKQEKLPKQIANNSKNILTQAIGTTANRTELLELTDRKSRAQPERCRNETAFEENKENNVIGQNKTNPAVDGSYQVDGDSVKDILIHVVEGFVIQESKNPFPISDPVRMAASSSKAKKKQLLSPCDSTNAPKSKRRNISASSKNVVALRPKNPFLKLDPAQVRKWTIRKLAKLLRTHGWESAATIFEYHEIDGAALFLTSSDNLLRIGLDEVLSGLIQDFISKDPTIA